MIYVFIFQNSDSLLIWISDRGNYNFAGADVVFSKHDCFENLFNFSYATSMAVSPTQ